MKKIILLFLAAFAWFHFYYIGSAPTLGPGIMLEGEPYQANTDKKPFLIDSFDIIPKRDFDARVRILAVEPYYFDRQSWLSPMDIVVGWDSLSDESIYSQIDFTQFDREYSWNNHSTEVNNAEITRQTANISLIPANNLIKEQLRFLKLGSLVVLTGTLVDVKRTMHWKWNSSLSREDQGKEASEILYLEKIEHFEP